MGLRVPCKLCICDTNSAEFFSQTPTCPFGDSSQNHPKWRHLTSQLGKI
jgi:hypothetical protein